jgi:glycosyltransferase involved in cell wall biosynthesis
MKFSVILPIYNVEAYLRECIESILNQSYKDFELILVNDGSKDKSPDICNEYAKNDTRIKVIHQKNAGQSVARNNGLAIASGDYIIFIDSDDFIISKDFLKKIAEKTTNHTDLIFFKFRNFSDKTKTLSNCRFSYKNASQEKTMSGKIQKLVDDDAFYGMAWIKAIRRLLLIENNINFENGLLGEDTEWNYHLLMYTKSIEFIDESFLAYRQREGSTSHSLKLKNLTDLIYVISKWSELILQIKDKDLKIALLGSLAKYYSNLLVVYMRVKEKEKKKHKQQLKKYSWLLNYSRSKRPQLISKVYNFVGFETTIMMLKILDKIKQ